jgi:hypothetical protein
MGYLRRMHFYAMRILDLIQAALPSDCYVFHHASHCPFIVNCGYNFGYTTKKFCIPITYPFNILSLLHGDEKN